MAEWEPIETAPRNNRPVLLFFPGGSMPRGDNITMARFQHGMWNFKNHALWGTAVRGAPTHWMPLPEAPRSAQPTANPDGP